MKTTSLIFGLALASAFALGVGCGGRVVIDQNEGSGQGGSTGSSGNTTGNSGQGSTGTNTTGTTSSGGFDAKSSCQQICDVLTMNNCSDPNCVEGCVNEYQNAGQCQDEFQVLVQCYLANIDTLANCGAPIPCDSAVENYNACSDGGSDCTDQSCSQDDAGNCSCAAACGGTKFSAACSPTLNGLECSCFIDGMPVGKCLGVANSCDIFDGCCGSILFSQDGG